MMRLWRQEVVDKQQACHKLNESGNRFYKSLLIKYLAYRVIDQPAKEHQLQVLNEFIEFKTPKREKRMKDQVIGVLYAYMNKRQNVKEMKDKAKDLRQNLLLKIHLNQLKMFKVYKDKKLDSMKKVELHLTQKLRQRVISAFKTKLEQTYTKQTNIRKQASFNLAKTQRYFPLLTAFNAIKEHKIKRVEKDHSKDELVRHHKLKTLLNALKIQIEIQENEKQ